VDVDARAPLAALVLTPDALVAVRRKGVDAPAHPLYWTGADDGAVVFCSRPMRGPGLHAPMLVLEGAHEEYAVRKGAVSA
jgi:hypothetical protein